MEWLVPDLGVRKFPLDLRLARQQELKISLGQDADTLSMTLNQGSSLPMGMKWAL